MHGIILLLNIVQMLTVLIDLVATDHSLKQKESIKVFMLPARSIIEDTDR